MKKTMLPLLAALFSFSYMAHAVTPAEPEIMTKDFMVTVEKEPSMSVLLPTENVNLNWQALIDAAMTSIPFVSIGDMDITATAPTCSVSIETDNHFELIDPANNHRLADYSVAYTTVMIDEIPEQRSASTRDLSPNAMQLIFNKNTTMQQTNCTYATLGIAAENINDTAPDGNYSDVIHVIVQAEL
jgi:hypothetical protein